MTTGNFGAKLKRLQKTVPNRETAALTASARINHVPVEDLTPQVVPDHELRVDAPDRGPERGVVLLKRASILGRVI